MRAIAVLPWMLLLALPGCLQFVDTHYHTEKTYQIQAHGCGAFGFRTTDGAILFSSPGCTVEVVNETLVATKEWTFDAPANATGMELEIHRATLATGRYRLVLGTDSFEGATEGTAFVRNDAVFSPTEAIGDGKTTLYASVCNFTKARLTATVEGDMAGSSVVVRIHRHAPPITNQSSDEEVDFGPPATCNGYWSGADRLVPVDGVLGPPKAAPTPFGRAPALLPQP